MSENPDSVRGSFQMLTRLEEGESEGQAMARIVAEPQARHSFLQHLAASALFADARPNATEMIADFEKRAGVVADGDLQSVSGMLLAQATTLDALFTDMTHRAIQNRAKYPEAFNRYMGLALKSQAQSRATLEALIKMHQTREQVVRHVHVHEGAQAVVAEQFHHHAAGAGNERAEYQAHGKGSSVASLSCPDPLGRPVPKSSGERKSAVPDARRREGKRRAKGK